MKEPSEERANGDSLDCLVVLREVVSETWRKANPRHCPVVIRDGDGKSVGACWHYLRDGACPSHGQIYEPNSLSGRKDSDETAE